MRKLISLLWAGIQIAIVLLIFYCVAIDNKHKEEISNIVVSIRVSPCYTLSCKGCNQETVICNQNKDTTIINK